MKKILLVVAIDVLRLTGHWTGPVSSAGMLKTINNYHFYSYKNKKIFMKCN